MFRACLDANRFTPWLPALQACIRGGEDTSLSSHSPLLVFIKHKSCWKAGGHLPGRSRLQVPGLGPSRLVRHCLLNPGLGGNSTASALTVPGESYPYMSAKAKPTSMTLTFINRLTKTTPTTPAQQPEENHCKRLHSLLLHPACKADCKSKFKLGRRFGVFIWHFGAVFCLGFFTFFELTFLFQWCKAWEVGSFFTDLPAAGCYVNDYASAWRTAEHSNRAHPPKEGSHQPYSLHLHSILACDTNICTEFVQISFTYLYSSIL